jgi:hypothetical protein
MFISQLKETQCIEINIKFKRNISLKEHYAPETNKCLLPEKGQT